MLIDVYTKIWRTLTHAITPLGKWLYFINAICFLVERNQLLGKVTNLWVDVYVHTNVSIPKGRKFDYEY